MNAAHAIAAAWPGGPYPPPAPNATPYAWGIIAFFAVGLALRFGAKMAARGRRRR